MAIFERVLRAIIAWNALETRMAFYRKPDFSNSFGGGGGSRTPVRRDLRSGAYMFSPIRFQLSPAALRNGQERTVR